MSQSLYHRRQLRRDQTPTESLLWRLLRGRRFQGFKFRRQHPCGPYILDFCCLERGLVIELDGGQHHDAIAAAYDQCRTAFLRQRGLFVLRFLNPDLRSELEAVLLTIMEALENAPANRAAPPLCTPLPSGERPTRRRRGG